MQAQTSSASAKRITWTSESIGYRTLSNGRRSYCYRFRDADGKQRCFFLGAGSSEKQAKDRLAVVRVQRAKGEDVRISHEPLSVFAERWLDEQTHLAASTARDYRGHLTRY